MTRVRFTQDYFEKLNAPPTPNVQGLVGLWVVMVGWGCCKFGQVTTDRCPGTGMRHESPGLFPFFLSFLSFCLVFMTRCPAPAAFSSGKEDDRRPHTFTFTCTRRRLGPIQPTLFLLSLKDTRAGGEKNIWKDSSGGFCSWRLKGRAEGEKKREERKQRPLCSSEVLIHNWFCLMHSWESFNCLSLHSNGVFVAF